MAQFINAREDIITEAVDGLVAASGGRLARLDGYPFVRVVVRTDRDPGKVALVSGGGSGHEPAHAGFVGRGMLTAAVCGDVFASPSVEAVLAGILAVTGEAGCLLIVKNYTGDRLNFGLAAERARAFGRKVDMVVIEDDVALPDLPRARGVAGTLLVHKIAGAMAEEGAPLDEIAAAARRVAARLSSLGMSLDTCTVPGSPKDARIAAGQAELGLGIHGEAGAEQIAYANARTAMDAVAAKLAPRLDGEGHVALLNNLGGTTELEMAILAEELRRSKIGARISGIVGPAALMTSLNMHGFSVSLYRPTEAERRLLAAPAGPPAWPGLDAFGAVAPLPLPDGLRPIRPTPSDHAGTRALLTQCCEALIAAEADLNALDARAGDGDTGSTLSGAARALIAGMDRLPLADHTQLFRAIGQELSQTMGGSSGVLLAIFFAATGDAASSGHAMPAALRAGLQRMQEIGGAGPGDRTMIDALAPALDALPQGPAEAARAARAGADATKAMDGARAGRAAYVNAEQMRGFADPGAEAVARLFERLAAKDTATAG